MPSPSRLSHRKKKGEWAEIQFLSRANALGLIVSKPWGDSAGYDFVVQARRRLHRIQVKSGWIYCGRRYPVMVTGSGGRRYPSQEVDFIAAYIVPRDAWYIIPIRALKGRNSIRTYPHVATSRGRFERYREAWHLLS